jgi:MFS family permease
MTMGDLRRFHVLVASYGVSSFGSYLNMVALNLFVYEATGSAVATGLFMVLRMTCGFIAGLLGGVVAARLPRKAVMISCDAVQAGVLLTFAVVPQTVRLDLLPVVAVSIGLLSTTSAVLLRSSVPELVGPEHSLRANGLLVTSRAVAMVAGFAIAGVLVSWLGYQAAFGVNAGTFAVSAVILAVLALRFAPRATGEAMARLGYRARTRLTVAALVAAPAVLAITVIRAVDAFGSASHQVGIPIYSTQLRPDDPASFAGNFYAAWAVGLFTAHQLVTRLYRSGRRHDEWAFVTGTAVMSAAFIAGFAGIPLPWVLLVALVAGMADGFTEITYTTRVQAEPEPARGYFFGLTAMAENAGLGIGMVVASGLLEAWQPFWVAAVMHGLVVVLALGYLAVALTRGSRRASELIGS